MRTGVFAAFSGGKIFSGFPGFSAPAERGARTASACSPLTGGSFFLHRKAGAHELRQRVRPDGAAPFLHRLTGVRELRQRVRPFRAESFSLNLSGGSPSADGGSVAAPAAGAKRKDNLRFSFLFELLPFPCFLIWRRLPTCDRSETGVRQSGYRSVSFSAFSQFTDSVLLHIWATLRRARHNSVAQILGTL